MRNLKWRKFTLLPVPASWGLQIQAGPVLLLPPTKIKVVPLGMGKIRLENQRDRSWGCHYGACVTALFIKRPTDWRTDSWTASKDYLNFSIFCKPRFERVILATVMMDVAKNASNPPSRKYVLEWRWITSNHVLLARWRSPVMVVQLRGLFQKEMLWASAHAPWISCWGSEGRIKI